MRQILWSPYDNHKESKDKLWKKEKLEGEKSEEEDALLSEWTEGEMAEGEIPVLQKREEWMSAGNWAQWWRFQGYL